MSEEREDIFYGLSQIPGVGYSPHPGVDRNSLPRLNEKPQISRFSYDSRPQVSISWELPGGVSTSQSPASAWASSGDAKKHWKDVVRRLYEAVELPGSPSDYHFALLGAIEVLWSSRRQYPEALPEIERLCLLDVKLVEVRREIGQMGRVEKESFGIAVPAFGYLIKLYEREGLVADALAIARRGAMLGQFPAEVGRLEGRLRDLEAEHA